MTLAEKLLKFSQSYDSALIIGNIHTQEVLFANDFAGKIYGVTTDTQSIDPIFSHDRENLFSELRVALQNKTSSLYYDYLTKKPTGEHQLADIHFGFFNQEHTEYFVEITPKANRDLEILVDMANSSQKPSFIAEFDDNFTLYHVNEVFHEKYSSVTTCLSTWLQASDQSSILQEIKSALEQSTEYQTELSVMDIHGDLHWYYLDIQKRPLYEGSVKLFGFLVPLGHHQETKERLHHFLQYYQAVQTLSEDSLYVVDVEHKVAYFSGKILQELDFPKELQQFPDSMYTYLHPEDLSAFKEYVNLALSGQETTSFSARLQTSDGSFQWYEMFFASVYHSQGHISEIFGKIRNVHNQVLNVMELDHINSYFNILQSLTKNLLYRLDIETRTLYRNKGTSQFYGIPPVVGNYPAPEVLKGVFHPEDISGYSEYIEAVLEGVEGSYEARMITPSGAFEYHRFTFQRLGDGSLKEMIGIAVNIQQQVVKEKELQTVNQYFNAIQDLSEDLLFLVNIQEKKLYRRWDKARIFGLQEVMEGFPESVCEAGNVHPEDIMLYIESGHLMLKGVSGSCELRMKSPTGDYAYRKITWTPVLDAQGNLVEMFGKMVNVQSIRDLEEKANFDALTNAFNKQTMYELTRKLLEESSKNDYHALFFIDLDDFKYVNDNLGHNFGDFLLQELGSRFIKSTRSGDYIGRVGGDEFVILLRDIPSPEILVNKAKLILENIGKEISDGTVSHVIHASIGISVFPDHGSTYEELYKCADLALYRSKELGKNVASVYRPPH